MPSLVSVSSRLKVEANFLIYTTPVNKTFWFKGFEYYSLWATNVTSWYYNNWKCTRHESIWSVIIHVSVAIIDCELPSACHLVVWCSLASLLHYLNVFKKKQFVSMLAIKEASLLAIYRVRGLVNKPQLYLRTNSYETILIPWTATSSI